MTPNASTPANAAATALLQDGKSDWSLDPATSSVEFHEKHFWGAITVHGRFRTFDGSATVGSGSASGQLRIEAASLETGNRKRDDHLRSADLFDAEHHPMVVVDVRDVQIEGDGLLRASVSLDAAGHTEPIDARIELVSASPDEVTVHGEALVDRTRFEMSWSPLGMASKRARIEVTARFVRRPPGGA